MGRGQEAKLCFSGHVLMENRNGLVLDVLQDTGYPSRLRGRRASGLTVVQSDARTCRIRLPRSALGRRRFAERGEIGFVRNKGVRASVGGSPHHARKGDGARKDIRWRFVTNRRVRSLYRQSPSRRWRRRSRIAPFRPRKGSAPICRNRLPWLKSRNHPGLREWLALMRYRLWRV